MPRSYSSYASKPASLSGFQVTGGPVTKAGLMADKDNLSGAFNSFRKKSSSINEIPGLNMQLGALEYATDKKADLIRQEAEWNADVLKEQTSINAGLARKKGEDARNQGFLNAAIGVAGAALMFSDERTKNTIEHIYSALDVLRNLRPVTFYYNEDYSSNPERIHYGFVAQEYAKHMPDATYYDESTGMLCIDTAELIALLVRANQELETRITRLEAKQALAGVIS